MFTEKQQITPYTDIASRLNSFTWAGQHCLNQRLKSIVKKCSSRFGFTFPGIKNAKILKVTVQDKLISIGKIEITNRGNSSNYVIFCGPVEKKSKLKIEFSKNSNNNVLIVGKKIALEGEVLFKGNNNSAIFSGQNGKKVRLKIDFNNADDSLFFWGKGSTSYGSGNRAIIRGSKVQCLVGDDCMFSHNITIRTSDMHTIFDLNSKQKINNDGDVIISSHVWIGQDVLMLKNSSVGFGSIIGSKSLIVSHIPAYSVAVGTPAKVLRENCSWDRMSDITESTIDYILAFDNQKKNN